MAKQLLHFLGIGSCFNTVFGNTSAYYYDKNDQRLFLIDCGEQIFATLRNSLILQDAKHVDILITHFHSDHAGSLESLVYWCCYVKGIIPTVIFPNKLETSIELRNISSGLYNAMTPTEYSHYNIVAYKQVHSQTVEAYAYLMNIKGETIYYSGDGRIIPSEIIQMLHDGNISFFYQEVSRYRNDVHMYIEDLKKLISPEKRKHVICMHFDDDETRNVAQANGFVVAERCLAISLVNPLSSK